MDAFWIILTGTLVSISIGLLGCFLVLRKMAMVGDAIAHAVLPGIVIAFLFSNSLSSTPVIIGATITGITTTFLIEFLNKKLKIQGDAAIGIIYTLFFAVGIILVTGLASDVHLDTEHILYGEIALVPLDLWFYNGVNLGPRPVWILSVSFLLVLLFIWKGRKGLAITTFNPDYATLLGLSTVIWQYALMSAVSLTTVISFESVGGVMVVAFLVIPPTTAYLLSNDLKQILWFTALFGFISSLLGYFISNIIDGSITGAIVTVSGILFFFALLYSKRKKKVKLEQYY